MLRRTAGFPVLYTNAKAGVALNEPDGQGRDLVPLFESIWPPFRSCL